MVGVHSTVGKRAKRMPDTTVETTFSYFKNKNFIKQVSVVQYRIAPLTNHKNQEKMSITDNFKTINPNIIKSYSMCTCLPLFTTR